MVKDRLALIVAFVALAVSLLGNATTLAVAESQNAARCQDSRENRNKIREQIQASNPLLLKEGDPGFDYWRLHPEEKAEAANNITESLDRFPEIICN